VSRAPRPPGPRRPKLTPKPGDRVLDMQQTPWTVIKIGPPAPHDRDRKIELRGEGPAAAPLAGPVKSITLATLQRCYRAETRR
jgi:hypothetical protein